MPKFDPNRRYKYFITSLGDDITKNKAGNAGNADFNVLLRQQTLSIPNTERGKCLVGLSRATLVEPDGLDDQYQIRCDLPMMNVADNCDAPLKYLATISRYNVAISTLDCWNFVQSQSLEDHALLCTNPFDRPVRFLITDTQGTALTAVNETTLVLDIQFFD